MAVGSDPSSALRFLPVTGTSLELRPIFDELAPPCDTPELPCGVAIDFELDATFLWARVLVGPFFATLALPLCADDDARMGDVGEREKSELGEMLVGDVGDGSAGGVDDWVALGAGEGGRLILSLSGEGLWGLEPFEFGNKGPEPIPPEC